MESKYENISLNAVEQFLLLPNSVLVDVRDEWEYEEFNMGGINIPMPEIRAKRHLLMAYEHIVVVCANGVRSRIAVKDYGRASELANKHFYHVEGGILGFE
jgi:rhodanese-related sulfurtransferase